MMSFHKKSGFLVFIIAFVASTNLWADYRAECQAEDGKFRRCRIQFENDKMILQLSMRQILSLSYTQFKKISLEQNLQPSNEYNLFGVDLSQSDQTFFGLQYLEGEWVKAVLIAVPNKDASGFKLQLEAVSQKKLE